MRRNPQATPTGGVFRAVRPPGRPRNGVLPQDSRRVTVREAPFTGCKTGKPAPAGLISLRWRCTVGGLDGTAAPERAPRRLSPPGKNEGAMSPQHNANPCSGTGSRVVPCSARRERVVCSAITASIQPIASHASSASPAAINDAAPGQPS
ncbi:hypothetical protein NDU88_005858 [Pleurodeles waltl]|uniref:Uncharacterized protein n=1 Tax=Pleurodeles waltl TaxID=8319 RepID=A0AAV7UNA4_PLEWA|nr:hypothetical protein NDU88_005858 [Pleurodeles waltl]